jgi:hypothetical protein
MKLIILFIFVFLASCSRPAGENESIHIVPQREPIYLVSPGKTPPPPPPITSQDYYQPLNFIVDTNGIVYFYQHKNYGWNCGSGGEEYFPPSFIALTPDRIFRLPKSSTNDILKYNLFNLDKRQRGVSVALTRDTVLSQHLSQLLNTFQDSIGKLTWFVRRTTIEEDTVFKYYLLHKYYNPYIINWDSSKVLFPPEPLSF